MGNQKSISGQITIYFALMLLFIITCLAFVINVGMFVKAKINLQNAVDAAAFAGASVQARQLSHIAYLNWEMRNNYKEWMFKYYVLGTMSLTKTDPGQVQRFNKVDFRMRPGFSEDSSGTAKGDYFNVPSICINPAQADSNICEIYYVPGIPRFAPLGLTGVDETVAEFTNIVSDEKAKSCIERSELNFLTAVNWAYGVGHMGASSPLLAKTPRIAWQRPGAWIQGLELALRIRNLEKIVNMPPQPSLCSQGDNCQPIQNFHQQSGTFPLHERTVKAFWSAFRNLENNDGARNLKNTFKLSELSPQPIGVDESSLGGLLIPGPVQKYYVDLYLNTVNYVTFFTLFTPRSSKFGSGSSEVQAEAACAGIKTGLPVPGFPFGYSKNPDILTYYAVKGEANYIGLFNPFSSPTGIPMVAYAAAKPFGGRIGPHLFRIVRDTPGILYPRLDPPRSFPYISGLSRVSGSGGTGVNRFLGYPIPSTQGGGSNFWVTDPSSSIGGIPSALLRFGIPNLLYALYDLTTQGGSSGGAVQIVAANMQVMEADPVQERGGLYDVKQYLAFRRNIMGSGSDVIAPAEVYQAITNVRSPTMYEAMNYMIPSTFDESSDGASTPGMVVPTSAPYYHIFAPLWSENGGLSPESWGYYQPQTIQTIVHDFITKVGGSINLYVQELAQIANAIRQDSQNLSTELGSSTENYMAAANGLHDSTPTCGSLAGKYLHFFMPPACPGGFLLENAVIEYWRLEAQKGGFDTHYLGTLPPYNSGLQEGGGGGLGLPNPNRNLMTGYQPGIVYGASDLSGVLPHPFLGQGGDDNYITITDRNFYSTKFIPVGSLFSNDYDGLPPYATSFATYSEEGNRLPGDMGSPIFKNSLNSGDRNVQLILQKQSASKNQFPVRQ